jgi:hypothetical protein
VYETDLYSKIYSIKYIALTLSYGQVCLKNELYILKQIFFQLYGLLVSFDKLLSVKESNIKKIITYILKKTPVFTFKLYTFLDCSL